MWPTACIASSRNGPERSKPSSTSPASPFSITVASSRPRKQEFWSWPKWMRSPAAMRLPGRIKACQRSGATRICSVASTWAIASPRLRMPFSCADARCEDGGKRDIEAAEHAAGHEQPRRRRLPVERDVLQPHHGERDDAEHDSTRQEGKSRGGDRKAKAARQLRVDRRLNGDEGAGQDAKQGPECAHHLYAFT